MFYVYVLINPKNNKPFYVGKGTKNRYLTHQNFSDKCNNPKKDKVVKNILKEYKEVPYKIVKNFTNEDDAYDFEEYLIEKIGIKNLTNICLSRRPPSQKGRKRNSKTIKMISQNSSAQGLQRTINHVIENKDIFYKILIDIKEGERRGNTIKKLGITIDLYNKIKKNYNKYINLLNTYTDYNVPVFKKKKINGMRAKLYTDNRKLLEQIFHLQDKGKKRKDIIDGLNISPAFYDRVKHQKNDFFNYFKD